MCNEDCPICLLPLGSKNVLITECGHSFCTTCFLTNFQVSNTCPLCRKNILPEDSTETHIDDEADEAYENEMDTKDEVEILMDATNIEDFVATKIFEVIPGSSWQDSNEEVQSKVKSILHEQMSQLVLDFEEYRNVMNQN